MYETLLRPHEVSQVPRLIQIDAITEKLKQFERSREDKRQRQIATSRARRNATEKRKREDDDNAEGVIDLEPEAHELETKKARTAAAQGDDTSAPDVNMTIDEDVMEEPSPATAPVADDALLLQPAPAPAMQVLSRHSKEVRGHTSFLTFACLLPITRL
jgi:tRNA (adenine57-N1/adenine58-N1)-methyltransferase